MIQGATPHILVVEDETKIADIIEKYLFLEGYTSTQVNDGNQVLTAVASENPDLIILDIMLPGVTGIELCKKIRQTNDVPIIMLTARVDEVDHLLGFGVGADDYVCKPFKPKELMARVKAILKRRVHIFGANNTLSVANIVLSQDEFQVHIDGTLVKLTTNEFNLLKVLMSHPNKVFSREELLTQTQGKYVESYERSIDSHIKNLRKKLINVDPRCQHIESIYGVGYKFKL